MITERERSRLTLAAELNERRAEHYFELKRKYERLAKRPWLPVAPDPPLPK
jgi:hypothetical protein